jgi:type IV pilus assembly protein PilA
MLRKLRESQQEEGFTLIELLVVVIIIGILAAIAIPVFLAQRERAWRSAAQSDLRNAAVSMETYYTDEGEYTNASLTSGFGFNATEDVEVATAYDATTNAQAYCMRAVHHNLAGNSPVPYWYLGTGGNLADNAGDGCPEVASPTFTAVSNPVP